MYVWLIRWRSLTRYSETDRVCKCHFGIGWPSVTSTGPLSQPLVVHIFDPLIEGIRDTYCTDNPLQALTQSCRQVWGDCSSNATHNYNSGWVCPPSFNPSPSNPGSTTTTSTHVKNWESWSSLPPFLGLPHISGLLTRFSPQLPSCRWSWLHRNDSYYVVCNFVQHRFSAVHQSDPSHRSASLPFLTFLAFVQFQVPSSSSWLTLFNE